jgi:hypothetical protein
MLRPVRAAAAKSKKAKIIESEEESGSEYEESAKESSSDEFTESASDIDLNDGSSLSAEEESSYDKPRKGKKSTARSKGAGPSRKANRSSTTLKTPQRVPVVEAEEIKESAMKKVI